MLDGKSHVLGYGLRIEKGSVLEKHAEGVAPGSHLRPGHSKQVLALDQDASAIGPQQSGDELEEHALPHPARTQYTGGQIRRDTTAYPAKHLFLPEPLGNLLQLDHGSPVEEGCHQAIGQDTDHAKYDDGSIGRVAYANKRKGSQVSPG